MKRKNILLIIGLIIIVAFTSHIFATDYNTGSSGSLNGLGSGSWNANPIGMRVSIVDSTGKLEVAKRVLSTQHSCSKSYNFNTNNKPKFLLSDSDTINRWASTNDYICTSYLPSNRGWLDTDNTTLNLNSHLSASDYSNLKSILSDSNFSDKLSPGDFIIIEPMTILGDYFGTAYELGNSFWEDENVSSFGDFVETYSGAIFGGLNKDGRRDGGLFYKTIYLDTSVTELGLTVYTDASTYDSYWDDIIVPRNNCLKSKTCGRGIGVYKYDDIFDPPEVEKFTLDLNYCVDGKINFDLRRYPTNFSYDFTLNDVNSSLTYHFNSVESGARYNISNIAVIGNDYEYEGYNVSTKGNCAVNNTSNNISGTVESHTSVNLIFKTKNCQDKLTDIKKSDGTYDPKDLFDLYKFYLDKDPKIDYRGLLNIKKPECVTGSEPSEKTNETIACLSATTATIDNFSENNLSSYTGDPLRDSKTNIIGFCKNSMNLENKLGTRTFSAKSGQFLIRQRSKNSIEYNSGNIICGKSIADAIVERTCYVLNGVDLNKELSDSTSFFKNKKEVSIGFGYDKDGNIDVYTADPKPVDELNSEGDTTSNSSILMYKDSKKFEFKLKTVYLDKITGKQTDKNTPGATAIQGVISKFNSSSGEIPFEIYYGDSTIRIEGTGTERESRICEYNNIPEIVVNNKLNLEFRTIDTSIPFGREPNSNWNDGSGSNIEDNQLIKDNIINATNSYGMLNGEKQIPLYRIELGPDDIDAIRKYNKENAYDNYSVECSTDMGGVTTCENTFLKGLENGYIKTKPEGGKQLNISNKLINNSNSVIKYYNPEDSSTGFDVSSSFEDDDDVCSFEPSNATPSKCFEIEELSDGTIEIRDYVCDNIKDVVIPEKINGKKVTVLGRTAFISDELTSVIIPNSVTTIGDLTFAFNELTSVVIPDSVTSIGDWSFDDNELTSVIISNSLTSIGNWTFIDNKLTSVVIPNSVTSIGTYAFKNNKLTSVVIPNSVASIGSFTFANNELISVIIQKNRNTLSFSDFTFGWANGYSDANIIWQP